MEKNCIHKELVFGIVLLLVGIPIYSVAGTQQNLKYSGNSDHSISSQTLPFEKNVVSYLDQLNNEEQHQLQQMFDAGLNLYVIVSTSGSGHAIPVLLKIPHLKLKGFFFAGIITYPGLSAMTTVWRLVNMTKGEVVDVGVGPHVVMFIGIGYAAYKRIILGGAGSMIGISIAQPSIIP